MANDLCSIVVRFIALEIWPKTKTAARECKIARTSGNKFQALRAKSGHGTSAKGHLFFALAPPSAKSVLYFIEILTLSFQPCSSLYFLLQFRHLHLSPLNICYTSARWKLAKNFITWSGVTNFVIYFLNINSEKLIYRETFSIPFERERAKKKAPRDN